MGEGGTPVEVGAAGTRAVAVARGMGVWVADVIGIGTHATEASNNVSAANIPVTLKVTAISILGTKVRRSSKGAQSSNAIIPTAGFYAT